MPRRSQDANHGRYQCAPKRAAAALHDTPLQAVYDGREYLGAILPTGNGFRAVDSHGHKLGSFPTSALASKAIDAAREATR